MSADQQRRWCLFTSAGDRNAIRVWLEGDKPRQWDLVVAYYGDNDHEYFEITKLSSYAFRTKGSKFQNLKKLVVANPEFFDQYSLVWVCDDDILMSSAKIAEAFDITESLGFWVAQPADRLDGRNSHWITFSAGPRWDYRIVNFIELRMPIFRRDKLIEYLAVYDGSLTGWGIEFWCANFFRANEFGRFAIIDKVQVVNPTNQRKGGSEIDRLQAEALRQAAWREVREKHGLVEYPNRIFAYCKLAPERELLRIFMPIDENPPITPLLDKLWRAGWRRAAWLVRCGLIVRAFFQTVRGSGWREAIWFLRCGLTIRRQVRAVNYL